MHLNIKNTTEITTITKYVFFDFKYAGTKKQILPRVLR